jgi:uncharacterized protein (DUF1330 family)
MEVVNKVLPSPAQMATFFAGNDDAPFVMINLLKFKDRADYGDGADNGLSGREAYGLYGAAAAKLIAAAGGKMGFGGAIEDLMIGEVEDLWDMIALVEWPSRAVMKAVITAPEYQLNTHHRTAGLAGQLNIRARSL